MQLKTESAGSSYSDTITVLGLKRQELAYTTVAKVDR